MHNFVVIAMLLTFCYAYSDTTCKDIVRNYVELGIVWRFANVKGEAASSTLGTFWDTKRIKPWMRELTCDAGKAVIKVFEEDFKVLLCLQSTVDVIDKYKRYYDVAISKCKLHDHIKELHCGKLPQFERCHIKEMPLLWNSLVTKEREGILACEKCNEFGKYKKCASEAELCNALKYRISTELKTMLRKSCDICYSDPEDERPKLQISMYVLRETHATFNCSTKSSHASAIELRERENPFRKRIYAYSYLAMSKGEKGDKNISHSGYFVDQMNSYRKELFVKTIRKSTCHDSNWYVCVEQYYDEIGVNRNISGEKHFMEVIDWPVTPILELPDLDCNRSEEHCKACEYNGPPIGKVDDIINVTCTVNVSFPKDSYHDLELHFKINNGKSSKITNEIVPLSMNQSANFSFLPKQFSCMRSDEISKTFSFSPKEAGMLRLQCVLIFRAQDLVKKAVGRSFTCAITDGPKDPAKFGQLKDKQIYLIIGVAIACLVLIVGTRFITHRIKVSRARMIQLKQYKIAEQSDLTHTEQPADLTPAKEKSGRVSMHSNKENPFSISAEHLKSTSKRDPSSGQGVVRSEHKVGIANETVHDKKNDHPKPAIAKETVPNKKNEHPKPVITKGAVQEKKKYHPNTVMAKEVVPEKKNDHPNPCSKKPRINDGDGSHTGQDQHQPRKEKK